MIFSASVGRRCWGLSLGSLLEMQAASGADLQVAKGRGAGKAKSLILIFLQGGPSHLDLWDPKPNLPDNMVGPFKARSTTKLPGVKFYRAAAEAVANDRQGNADPLDELHARAVCSTTRPPSIKC